MRTPPVVNRPGDCTAADSAASRSAVSKTLSSAVCRLQHFLAKSRFVRRRLLGPRTRSPTLGHRGGCPGSDRGVDLPLVRAIQAGIDERTADIVVNHPARCRADGAPDEQRHGGHRRIRHFFSRGVRRSLRLHVAHQSPGGDVWRMRAGQRTTSRSAVIFHAPVREHSAVNTAVQRTPH